MRRSGGGRRQPGCVLEWMKAQATCQALLMEQEAGYWRATWGSLGTDLGKTSCEEAVRAKTSWVQERAGGQKLERMSMDTVLRKFSVKGEKSRKK